MSEQVSEMNSLPSRETLRRLGLPQRTPLAGLDQEQPVLPPAPDDGKHAPGPERERQTDDIQSPLPKLRDTTTPEQDAMDVPDGDPGPEQRGHEAAPPVDLEDVVQAGGGGARPEAAVRQEHVRQAELRVRGRRADVERREVVYGAHEARDEVDALEMLDVCGRGRGGCGCGWGGGSGENEGREREEDVDEGRRRLPEEDEELCRLGVQARVEHGQRREQVAHADAEEQAARVREVHGAAAGVVRVGPGGQRVREVVERDDGGAGYGLVEEDEEPGAVRMWVSRSSSSSLIY